jgi:hypothetical protein
MKLGGYCLIGLGLLLTGLVTWYIPVSLLLGGVAAIIFDHEFKI